LQAAAGKMETLNTEKVIILHGFSNEEAVKILRSVKAASENPSELIFASTTPTSLEWKVSELIAELTEEHVYFKNQEKNKA
jgi:hypothetical protein